MKRHQRNRSPKITSQAAAHQAGVSYGTWRNITRGLRYRNSGEITTYRAEPEVLARVALVLGITPDELRDVDRADAARSLEVTLRNRSPLSAFPTEQLIAELASRVRPADPYGIDGLAANDTAVATYDLARQAEGPTR